MPVRLASRLRVVPTFVRRKWQKTGKSCLHRPTKRFTLPLSTGLDSSSPRGDRTMAKKAKAKPKPAVKAKPKPAAKAKAAPAPKLKKIPPGSRSVTPHLVVREAANAIEFYKKAFGAQEIRRAPGPDGKLMHAELQI